MSKPDSRDWMLKAFCRGKNPNLWSTDSRKGPMQRYAEELCSPCRMHAQCASYFLSQEDTPVGIIAAGVAVPEDPASQGHERAIKRLEFRAKGEVPPHVA